VIADILGINAICWALIGAFWISEQRKARQHPQSEVHRHALQMAKMMARSPRLHKELDAVAGDLLEESARSWREIMLTFDGPFWSSQNLPAHWQAIKKQTSSAATVAMEEQLVLLRDSYQPLQSAGLKDVVEDVIENYVTGVRVRKSGRFPVAFDHARAIAEKLRQTSIEIARTTQDISQSPAMQNEYSSADALDLALGDIRSVKQAEEELRQNVSG